MAVDIGNQFYHKLINRNKLQGDGKFNAEQFRDRFLSELDSDAWWSGPSSISLDFKNVEVIGPSWANEIFAYYLTKHKVDKKIVLTKIECLNLTRTKKMIINRELDQGYKGYRD